MNNRKHNIKIVTIVLMLFVSFHYNCSFAQDINKQKIDFLGVDAFWNIAEKIKNDTVTELDWDQLFSTGYYKFYEKWGRKKYIQNNLMVALSPQKNIERDSLIQKTDFNAFVLKQIISTYTNKQQLQAFQKKLEQSGLRNKIIQRVKQFLPSDVPTNNIEPFIYFGVFQPDANASDKSIAVDLKLFNELADAIGLIAHEYHHFLTMNYKQKFKQIENDSTSLIIKFVLQLQLEGIADMIDKDKFLNSNGIGFPSILSLNFKQALADPLPALKKIDSLLVIISKNPLTTKQHAETIINALPLGGHPHGFYMAKTIFKAYGKKELLSTLKNPFNFIRLFNKAFLKLNGTTIISQVSINYLSQIENTHSL